MPPKTPKKTPTPKAVKSIIDVDADGRKQPTAGEAFLFYTIIKNLKNKPDIDWAGVAVDNNFKNAETAKVSKCDIVHLNSSLIIYLGNLPAGLILSFNLKHFSPRVQY
jgi:hypothetical protein